MLSINTNFHPFRMNLKNKEPVQLTVEIINRGQKEKMLSLQLALARELSLDKSGIVNTATKKIESLKPGESKIFYFDIYSKVMTRPGEKDVVLKVLEHYRDFKFIQKEHTEKMTLRVEE